MLRVPRRSQRLSGLPVTRSVHALHRERRGARSLRDEPVLLFDDGARGSIAVEAAEDVARHPAIGALGTIFVDHVEKRELDSRCGLACHVLGSSCCSTPDVPHDDDARAVNRGHVRQSVKKLRCRAPELLSRCSKRSDVLEVRRIQLAALAHNVVGELLSFVQIAHARPLHCGDMDEYVRSAVGRLNESKALL